MKNYFLFIILFYTSNLIFAQHGSIGASEARSMGMAKTYNSAAYGIYALGINPANLLNDSSYTVNISTLLPLPDVSGRGGTNFITFDDFNYFFGGVNGQSRILDSESKQRFNNLFNDGGLGFGEASAGLLSFSYNIKNFGAFAFSINDFAGGRVDFPKAIADIAFSGNQHNTIYSLNDANVKSWWIRNYALTSAIQIEGFFDKLFLGMTFKLVHGYAYAGTERSNTYFITGNANQITGRSDLRALSSFSDDIGVKYDFDPDSLKKSSNLSLFPSPSGKGFGIDVGFSAIIEKDWYVSLSVTDLGSINWTDNAAEYLGIDTIKFDDPTNKAQRDSLKDQIVGKGKRISNFQTDLATALRFGISHYFYGKKGDNSGSLMLAFDYNQGFNDMPGNSKKPRFSIGMEWKPWEWFPFIRSGISYGGELGLNWALGLGMDAGIVEFNIATSNFETVIAPNYAKQLSVAVGSRWKF